MMRVVHYLSSVVFCVLCFVFCVLSLVAGCRSGQVAVCVLCVVRRRRSVFPSSVNGTLC